MIVRTALLAIMLPYLLNPILSARAHDGNRTHGHTLTKGVLYRLSYVGQRPAAHRTRIGSNFTSFRQCVNLAEQPVCG
jgi:hypothetical protein